MQSYNSAAENPEDLIERERARQTIKTQKGMPIGYSSTEAGLAVTLILLTDKSGMDGRVVYTREELNDSLRNVRTAAGALDLISMRKLAGMGYDVLESSQSLCHADSITADQAGWSISNVEIIPQCVNSVIRDYRVQKTGETLIRNQRVPEKPKRICID
jgi:hypothetical protein